MNFNLNKWLLFLYFLPAAYPHFDVLFIFTGFLTNQFDKKKWGRSKAFLLSFFLPYFQKIKSFLF